MLAVKIANITEACEKEVKIFGHPCERPGVGEKGCPPNALPPSLAIPSDKNISSHDIISCLEANVSGTMAGCGLPT